MRSSLLVVPSVALLAAAPLCGAAFGSALTHRVSHHASASSSRSLRSSLAPTARTVYQAPFPSTAFSTSIYVYEPASTPNPLAQPEPAACQSDGSGCTSEQLCELWGEC